MANYTPSNLASAQARLLGAFASGEMRYRTPSTFLEFLNSSPILLPNYDQLRVREDRAITTYYKLRSSRALGSARSHNHTGTRGDSSSLGLSWTTYTDVITQSIKQGDNNIFNLQEIYNNDVQNAIINFANGFESAAASYVNANKTGVNNASLGADGTFDTDTDVFEIPVEKRGIQVLQTVMDINNWSNGLVVFCDSLAWNKINFYANQGAANAENTAFQFSGIRFVHTPGLTALGVALGYDKGYMVAAQTGTFAVLPWIPVQNRNGVVTSVNQYASLINPVDGLDYAVHSYESRADGSAVNGYTQDVTVETQISIDLAWAKAPLSTANETPFYAFGFVPEPIIP